MTLPFYTIGHSNRSIDDFVTLLKEDRIERVVDVRKMPASRANPQFGGNALQETLGLQQISYEHIAALGGLRGKAASLPADLNGLWENRSFRNYADYALSPEFRAGLGQLIADGRKWRCAIMCAEAVWWRCHRRIIADYLIARGETVFHIMGQGRLEQAKLTPGAVVQPNGTVLYPARTPEAKT